jgi:AraC-like DNA-binding protein
MCERILSSNPLSGSTQDAVKRLLVGRVGLGMCSLETAAEALRLSVSQLRKRLYQEETSYKQIVLEVRMTLAHHYLRATNLSIQEVAYLLDYSQPAPFSRAFKSYFGHPPVSVRQP